MKRTATILTGAVIATIGLTSVAVAHDGRGGRGMEIIFENVDTDQDGLITSAEIEAARDARFAEMDSNGDGFVTAEEIAAFADARRGKRAERMIERLDANEDGKLSAEEMAARGPGRMLERLDANGDGALSKDELAEARKMRRGGGNGPRHGRGND
ncbi:MAG: calcium-binding protein [Paracoccaceae bacterium]|nr:calcium-binding protein [Paracoccaceae bacterium]